jgi:hypothetical protein
MNQDQISGMVRIIVPAVCAWLAAKGFSWFGDEGVPAQIAVVVVGIASLVWSYFSHSDSSRLRSAAAIDPQIKISVPEYVIANNPEVARVVHDDDVQNVTEAR